MTMRDRLDFSLVSAAAAAGAEVQSSSEVLDVAAQAESVELVTTRGPRRARFVVAADGALSVVARRAGWPGHGALGPALEFEVFVHDEVHRRFRETARFDLGVVPGGYGWVFPKNDHLSIGLGMLRAPRGPVNLNRMFDRYLRFLGVDTIIRQERHGFVIPLRPRPGPYLRRRVLLTGDAAGFAEPVTGEGLTFALQSGQLAARAVLEGDFDEGRVREAYDAELRRSILPELRWGRVLAKLTYGYPRLHAWLCRRHGTEFSEALTDVFVGETTYREFLKNPRNYLRLFLDGAAR
jgi:flavin-dependent dehydrogenase